MTAHNINVDLDNSRYDTKKSNDCFIKCSLRVEWF